MSRCGRLLLAFAILVASAAGAAAQQPAPTPTPPPPSSQPDQTLLKPEQLEALVAPIALYPDALLANMLAAATYPLEVVEADRWIKSNKNLKGDALKTEVDKKGWDDSVKALTATPSVLDMMSDKLDWTKSLGDTMLAQQADLMDAIQRLREKARGNNKLTSNKQQKVTVRQNQGRQVIDLGIPGRGSRRLAKSAPIIADGMEVLTKLRPNIVPNRGIDDSVVKQNHRLTAVIRLLVVELTSIYVDKPG